MAKLVIQLKGDFDSVLSRIDKGILGGSISASYEDGADFQDGQMRVAVRVYERYSWWGRNRVSLNITLVANGNDLSLAAITAGGSQAIFYKINTLGEEAFLDRLREIIDGAR